MRLLLANLIVVLACQFVLAQQTNPVDRKVTNPLTDTPNVNSHRFGCNIGAGLISVDLNELTAARQRYSPSEVVITNP